MSDEISAAIAGNLPKGDGNGLLFHARDLADYPKKIRVAVVLFDCPKTVLKHEDDSAQVVARIRRIEIISDPADAAIMQRILMREFERRTGEVTLPFELETDVQSAFEGQDIDKIRDEVLAEKEREAAAYEEYKESKENPDEHTTMFSDVDNGDVPLEDPPKFFPPPGWEEVDGIFVAESSDPIRSDPIRDARDLPESDKGNA